MLGLLGSEGMCVLRLLDVYSPVTSSSSITSFILPIVPSIEAV